MQVDGIGSVSDQNPNLSETASLGDSGIEGSSPSLHAMLSPTI